MKSDISKEHLTVVKVGGAVVEDETQLSRLLDDFAAIDGHKVLVHGGGRSATRMAASMGIESQMVNGRRVTDADMLRVVTMVYGGLVNKNLVAQLQARGIDALGLTGADADAIRSHRRPAREVDYGFVGDVERADGDKLHALISQGFTPVMAPLTHDGHGQMLNTNADTIANEVAKALAAHYDVTLVYSFEMPGVMDKQGKVIPTITAADYDRYVADGTISGGMVPKIDNALQAVRAGVTQVVITKADAINGNMGTKVQA